MLALRAYPRWFLRVFVTACAALFASGLLLAPTTLVMRFEWDLAWRLPAAYRVTCVATHAALGSLALLAIGSLWTVHMRSGWLRRQQRGSGLCLAGLMLMLAATAVAVAYAGEADVGGAAALLHLAGGLVVAGVFGWHWWHGTRLQEGKKEAG